MDAPIAPPYVFLSFFSSVATLPIPMLLIAAAPPAQGLSYSPIIIAAGCALAVWIIARANYKQGAGWGCLSVGIVVFAAAGANWAAGPTATLFGVFSLGLLILFARLRDGGSPLVGGFDPSRFRRRPTGSPPPPSTPTYGRVAYPNYECPGCGAAYEADDPRCRFCGRPRAGA
ncbi:MAG TPA: hypothetical protein VFH27_02085 [Longimicrobiaceae bacterium]|nr:hypothetical protein [Longimicrobiaceae bacterium]